MDNNLIVCVTPLQMLIAEKIMDIHPADYTTIIIYYDNNNKYAHYINSIRKKSKKFLSFYVKGETKSSRFFEILKFRAIFKRFTKQRYTYCFIASIENPFVLSILSDSEFQEMRTFDDGTANINRGSIYYRELKIGRIESLVRKVAGVSWERDNVISNTSLHYTLYPGFDNIIEKLQPIYLLEENDIQNQSISVPSHSIDIFIGQPVGNVEGMLELISLSIEKYKIEYYYPHPRERDIIPNVKYIVSHLIFEDYVMQMLREKPDYKINIYTFHSTVSFNLINMPRINIFCLYNNVLNERYKDIYNLYRKDNRFVFLEV